MTCFQRCRTASPWGVTKPPWGDKSPFIADCYNLCGRAFEGLAAAHHRAAARGGPFPGLLSTDRGAVECRGPAPTSPRGRCRGRARGSVGLAPQERRDVEQVVARLAGGQPVG